MDNCKWYFDAELNLLIPTSYHHGRSFTRLKGLNWAENQLVQPVQSDELAIEDSQSLSLNILNFILLTIKCGTNFLYFTDNILWLRFINQRIVISSTSG